MTCTVKKILRFSVFLLVAALLLTGAASALTETPDETAENSRQFTDSFGRTVTLPAEVDKFIPSGGLAMTVLSVFGTDKFASIPASLTTAEKKYLPGLVGLPLSGSLFGSKTTMSMEEVMNLRNAGVDVLIDCGQAKERIKPELDTFGEITGIPGVFISQNGMDEIPSSFRMIGEVLGDEKRGEELAAYSGGLLTLFKDGMKKIGTKHTGAQISKIDGNSISLVGGWTEDKKFGYMGTVVNYFTDNIVVSETNTGNDYGMEQAMTIFYEKDPDFIFINGHVGPDGKEDHAYYNAFLANPAFKDLTAVKSGHVYEVPCNSPWSWTGSPYSSWALSGMIWMANVVYPDIYDYNVKDKIKEFYKIMLDYDMTDDEFAGLTKYSLTEEQKETTAVPKTIILNKAAEELYASGLTYEGYAPLTLVIEDDFTIETENDTGIFSAALLTIKGTKTLTVTGKQSAIRASDITIESGKIIAASGKNASGVSAALNADKGTITINGGEIYAYSSGPAHKNKALYAEKSIVINNGYLEAHASGEVNCFGLDGGNTQSEESATGTDGVFINGGTVIVSAEKGESRNIGIDSKYGKVVVSGNPVILIHNDTCGGENFAVRQSILTVQGDDAVIFISDSEDKPYTLMQSANLCQNFALPAGKKFLIEEGKTLTVAKDSKLTTDGAEFTYAKGGYIVQSPLPVLGILAGLAVAAVLRRKE